MPSNIPEPADLDRLVFDEAEPVIQRVVRWRLGLSAPFQDRDDVVADVLLALVSHLDSVARGNSAPVADFNAYAAVAAHHGCDRYLRRRFPQRHRLGNRVRYLLEHTSEYAVWRESDVHVCGFAKDKEKRLRTSLPPDWISQLALPAKCDEAKAVKSVLKLAERPLLLPDLIDAVATLLNIRDQTASMPDLDFPNPEPNANSQISHRQILNKLWSEIKELPATQRFALLMNLRDDEGACALVNFPALGVASIRDLAAAMELPALKLAELWKELPLSDLRIAGLLGITRQQVINLRKAARKRLARRTGGNMAPNSDSKIATATSV